MSTLTTISPALLASHTDEDFNESASLLGTLIEATICNCDRDGEALPFEGCVTDHDMAAIRFQLWGQQFMPEGATLKTVSGGFMVHLQGRPYSAKVGADLAALSAKILPFKELPHHQVMIEKLYLTSVALRVRLNVESLAKVELSVAVGDQSSTSKGTFISKWSGFNRAAL